MILYKNISVGTKNKVTIQEIEQIENYISKIYLWKEITKDPLPEFENINQADDLWIWEAIKKNLEEFTVGQEEIEEKGKELFGEGFERKIKKEENKSFKYEEETGKYNAIGMRVRQRRR